MVSIIVNRGQIPYQPSQPRRTVLAHTAISSAASTKPMPLYVHYPPPWRWVTHQQPPCGWLHRQRRNKHWKSMFCEKSTRFFTPKNVKSGAFLFFKSESVIRLYYIVWKQGKHVLKMKSRTCLPLFAQLAEQIGGVARSAEGVAQSLRSSEIQLLSDCFHRKLWMRQPLRVFDPPPLLTALRSVNRGGQSITMKCRIWGKFQGLVRNGHHFSIIIPSRV